MVAGWLVWLVIGVVGVWLLVGRLGGWVVGWVGGWWWW